MTLTSDKKQIHRKSIGRHVMRDGDIDEKSTNDN